MKSEGVKEYRIKEEEEAGYFIRNEYPVIRQANIPELVRINVREKNGKISAVYDLRGKMSLAEWLGEEHELKHSEILKMIEAFVQVMTAVEEHLLVMEKVKISCRDIYVDREGTYSFLYMPERDKKMRESLDKFFNWLISRVDYSDESAVKLVYDLYWHVRHEGFSRDIFEKYLEPETPVKMLPALQGYGPGEPQEHEPKRESAREIYRETYRKNDWDPYEEDDEEEEKTEKAKKIKPKLNFGSRISKPEKKNRKTLTGKKAEKPRTNPSGIFSRKMLMMGEGALGIIIFVDLAIAGIVGVAGYQQGFPPIAVRYMAICVVVGIIVGSGLKKVHDMRLATPEDIEKKYGAKAEKPEEDYFPI